MFLPMMAIKGTTIAPTNNIDIIIVSIMVENFGIA
jgi:hypothetical protein